MPRVLTATICALAFAAPIAAACLQVWPFLTSRPLPTGLDIDALFLVSLTLLCSAVLTVLMSAHIQSGVRRR